MNRCSAVTRGSRAISSRSGLMNPEAQMNGVRVRKQRRDGPDGHAPSPGRMCTGVPSKRLNTHSYGSL